MIHTFPKPTDYYVCDLRGEEKVLFDTLIITCVF